jgi:hypothetical protein
MEKIMKNYDELRKMSNVVYGESKILNEKNLSIVNSIDRALGICEQSDEIINDLEQNFLNNTKLSKNDIPFLFMAVSLQTLRWCMMPKLDLDYSQIERKDRLESSEVKHGGALDGKKSGRQYEMPEINKYKSENKEKYTFEENEYRKKLQGNGSYKYLSWIEILFHAVPYDAMDGSENILIKSKNIIGKTTFISPIGKQLNGKNHHVATLGHDPILGWIFGTMNIASSTITFCDLQTYPVIQNEQLDKWQQSIDYLHPTSVLETIDYCINSFREDYKRVPAAVARQAMHMQSDKYTKDGLQIPLLTPDKAQKLINEGWNSYELERILKKTMKNIGIVSSQFAVAEMINIIIRSIYLFANADKDIGIIKTKIERILSISSIMAETSNVAVVVATRNYEKLDVGGLISMVHQIALDVKTRTEMEMEFLNNEFDKLLMEDVYE